ncbi:DUF2946 family protein [Curvibacter sp. CHRR-16]|uniref:DUF2946 family protein n=1 Tax=Curvibacter sp. CHRR-16 TaxID=2835872 RepID=UPI001BDB319F|nr:DUF2946 family protein [Curvibacter sp. CHRR-16]MBT0571822.1 DUF2946 family protein [Curvibacter sp. CHRR-16]
MDDIVLQAMHKWPDVPACTGWLGLDERGDWYMRDATTQKSGAFQSSDVSARGSRLEHEKLIAFIGRNYTYDAQGRWYFQNGPQQVFVELRAAPWILRLQQHGDCVTHTGLPVQVQGVWTDERGYLYMNTQLGLGLVHSQDMLHAANWLEHSKAPVQDCRTENLPQQFGFVRSPQYESRDVQY